jgi:hypothetical protein
MQAERDEQRAESAAISQAGLSRYSVQAFGSPLLNAREATANCAGAVVRAVERAFVASSGKN